MYCNKCGTQNDENTYTCVNCNEILRQPEGGAEPAPMIPNYLVQSILVTLFCCLPFGIAAIVYAAQVNGKLQGGDVQGAMESSRQAKMWCWWSFGIGFAIQALYLVFYVFVFSTGMAETM